MTPFEQALRAALPEAAISTDAPLAPLTTFKVGGPADCEGGHRQGPPAHSWIEAFTQHRGGAGWFVRTIASSGLNLSLGSLIHGNQGDWA